MDPVDLERLIDRELRSLPAPRAPRTLLPAVMAAANKVANRPWYSRTWLQWPVGWQLASAVVLLGVVAAGSVVLPQLRDAVEAISFVADVRSDVASSTREVETATTAMRDRPIRLAARPKLPPRRSRLRRAGMRVRRAGCPHGR